MTSGDDTTAFQADDSEYNALNTDRELMAIRAIAKSLEKVDQKKSMLYFSGGLTRQGIENQASLRAATNEAAKANMAIYSVDTRGLQAMPPGGDASKASTRGSAAYSGGAMTSQLNANFSSQETLGTLSMDTGRQGVLRFERLWAGVPAGAARYRGVLHRGLPLDQPGAGRQLSPPDDQGEPARCDSSSIGRGTMRRRTSAMPRRRTANWR